MEQSLPEFLKKHKEKVAFVHIDCDLYSSTKTIFDCLKPRMQKGTILVFDEIIGYGGDTEPWRNHEFKAFEEFLSETKYKIDYIGKPHDFGGCFRII
jgi:predicted O-methyltransferase YrrM